MVRIRCESGVRIKILESGSTCICNKFGMIHGSGPCLDPESVAFCISLRFFFMDPDPRIRIRVRVSPNSFRKNLNMIFLKKTGSAPTF
jgi:hypothetical protein